MSDTDPHSYSSLCSECRIALGAKPKHPDMAVTAHTGECPRCKADNVVLIPTRDYRWPRHYQERKP